MPERNIQALEQLRRTSEVAPDDLWDMGQFTNLTACGTAHCAAGWFAVDPWARANTAISTYFDRKGHPMQSISVVIPGLSEIFGNSHDETKALFCIGSFQCHPASVERSKVIANIDRLLCGLDVIPYGELIADLVTA